MRLHLILGSAALSVACNRDVGECEEHASPLTPRSEQSDGSDVVGTWDDDDDGDGWTLGSGDCDDSDPAVHPGNPEVAGNGIDED